MEEHRRRHREAYHLRLQQNELKQQSETNCGETAVQEAPSCSVGDDVQMTSNSDEEIARQMQNEWNSTPDDIRAPDASYKEQLIGGIESSTRMDVGRQRIPPASSTYPEAFSASSTLHEASVVDGISESSRRISDTESHNSESDEDVQIVGEAIALPHTPPPQQTARATPSPDVAVSTQAVHEVDDALDFFDEEDPDIEMQEAIAKSLLEMYHTQ